MKNRPRAAAFALLLAVLAFLAAAAGADGGRTLVRFELVRSTDLPTRQYEVFLLPDGYYLSRGRGAAQPLDAETVRALAELAEARGVLSWDGFSGSNPYLLDGESFRLELAFSDGTTVFAAGSGRFPQGYVAAAAAMEALLADAAEPGAPVAGAYRYEGGGFGGDFTLTLDADGGYAFYEGPLSSYLGGGEWFQEGSRLYLSEKNGLPLFNVFIPVRDALVFAEADSDNFPYVRVPDGGRFLRQEPPDPSASLKYACHPA